MSFLTGLHGTVAAILICSLLFVDEAGIPLPIAPNEGLLLVTGILIASDAFSPWVIVPLAFLAMALGMLAGYGWARTVGQLGLQAIAERVGAAKAYDRAQARLKSASHLGIAVARLVPGIRPYATLAAGAAEVDIRTFMLGALPALILWEIVWILLGMLVGLPIAHLLGRFQRVALRGVVLIGLGVVAWFAVRNVSDDRRAGVTRLAPRLRALFALLVDAGIVASVVGGLFAIGRRVLDVSADGWIDLLVSAIMLIVLLIVGRRAQTPGEVLFETDYWRQPRDAAG